MNADTDNDAVDGSEEADAAASNGPLIAIALAVVVGLPLLITIFLQIYNH